MENSSIRDTSNQSRMSTTKDHNDRILRLEAGALSAQRGLAHSTTPQAIRTELPAQHFIKLGVI